MNDDPFPNLFAGRGRLAERPASACRPVMIAAILLLTGVVIWLAS